MRVTPLTGSIAVLLLVGAETARAATITVSVPELVGTFALNSWSGIVAELDLNTSFAAIDEVRIGVQGTIDVVGFESANGFMNLRLFDELTFQPYLSIPFSTGTTLALDVPFHSSVLPDLLVRLADGRVSLLFGFSIDEPVQGPHGGIFAMSSATVTVRGTLVPEPSSGWLAAVAIAALVWLRQSYRPSAHQDPASRSW